MMHFSDTLMDHFQSPLNQGVMEQSDVTGIAGTLGQGRYIQFFFRIVDDRVSRMQFNSYGCGVTIAVCSVLTELVEGKSRDECADIGVNDVIAALDGIPEHKQDCACLGIAALRHALEHWPAGTVSHVSDAVTS